MNSTTLRGIFPEPKPVHRKNFLKENAQHIKKMQTIIQGVKTNNQQLKTVQRLRTATTTTVAPPLQQQNQKFSLLPNKTKFEKLPKLKTKSEQKLTNRSVQTQTLVDSTEIYSSGGIVRYPSPSIRTKLTPKKSVKKSLDQGDQICDVIDDSMQKLRLGGQDKHNYVKENIRNVRNNNALKNGEQLSGDDNKTQPPIHYQKGVVPKYLEERRRKEEEEKLSNNLGEPNCYPGHILLPDSERKEYLRVSRESYADLIRELNAMPLKNDTLKMKKRKIEIEEELKKIEEAIKVFQKPKVFVKADM